MKPVKKILRGYFVKDVIVYLLICGLALTMSVSVALAGPKGKALGHSKTHGNPHVNLNLQGNPNNNLPTGGVLPPANSGVNPAGIIPGTGGLKATGTTGNNQGGMGPSQAINISTVVNPAECTVKIAGNNAFLGLPGSDVVIKISSLKTDPVVSKIKFNNGSNAAGGGTIVLAAGDVFSEAVANLGSLSGSVAAGGSQGNAHGHGWQGVDFNPGGGPDKLGEDGIGDKGWGTGNNGNGVGNIWVGNQGNGKGGGMAGGPKSNPPCDTPPCGPPCDTPPCGPPPCSDPPCGPPPCSDPPCGPPGGEDPPGPTDDEGLINTEAAPLGRWMKELKSSGCPFLIAAAADELGIPRGKLQIYFADSLASPTNIQACDACAQLIEYVAILGDADGSALAAMIEIFNNLAPAEVPFTPEMAASIATAFSEAVEEGEDPLYAKALEYIDAFVGYVTLLDGQFDSPVGDSTEFVMGKYGTPVLDSENTNMAAYIMMQF